MRVTDLTIKRNFLWNYNRVKDDLSTVQNQLSTQSMINKPSDSPQEIGSVMRIREEINDILTYRDNIDHSLTQVNEKISAMDELYNRAEALQAELAPMKNAVYADTLWVTAPATVEDALESMLEVANQKFQDKYLFAGSDYRQPPHSYDVGTNTYTMNSTSIGAEENIRIGRDMDVNLNVNGAELFQAVIKWTGNFQDTSPVGVLQTHSKEIYNAFGDSYNVNMQMEKTDDHVYRLAYQVLDGEANTVVDDSMTIVFDEKTREVKTVNGRTPDLIRVNNTAERINFYIDPTTLFESTSAQALAINQNQKADIFNVLAATKERLNARQQPTLGQLEIIENFSEVTLVKSAELGDAYNKIENARSFNETQEVDLKDLLSRKVDVDMPKKLTDLYNSQYNLDIMYKVSSTLLPQSLIDYF